jgi:hypothetical protein
MTDMRLASILALALAAATPVLSAAEFTVGGVKVTTAEDGWEVHEAKAPPVNIGGGGIDGTLPSEARLLVMRGSDGAVLAALVVSANRGKGGNLTLRGACPEDPPNDTTYLVRYGHPKGGPRTCALIGGPYDGADIVRNVERLSDTRAANPFEAPSFAYYFDGYAFAQDGSRFGIVGLVTTQWLGIEGKKPDNAINDHIKAEVAAWGDALGVSIKKAHEGFFSRSTTLPPLRFKAPDAPR